MGHVMKAAVTVLVLCWSARGTAGAGEVTGLTLVDAQTDRDIRALTDGATIDLAKDGGSLNVRADVAGEVGSVRFAVDGKTVQTENVAPYALAGDRGGDYSPWRPSPGRHVLTVTPYAESNGRGQAGKPLRLTFTVTGGPPAPEVRRVAPATTAKPGSVEVTGERRKWHKITFAFGGPAASETAQPNPFTDYRLNVTFKQGDTTYVVPGYYAADGDAAQSGAAAGNVWKAHFCPHRTGMWSWTASFRKGEGVAVSDEPDAGQSGGYFDGKSGTLEIGPTDKTGRDHRAKGRLQYVGQRYLRFAETGACFLKQGADAPENFLAYADFDGHFKTDGHKDKFVKTWEPHVRDWRPGDPAWRDGKGKGIVGAVNYLASEDMNAISFLTLNIGGDDRNVFPYLTYDERRRMDCSRLDQWEMVFEHMDRQGIYLHFKTQETENELLLDSGDLGLERRLYYRELIARFAHHLALNWNLGEEINNASTRQKKAWAQYFWDHDPYRHPIVIHNGANHYDLLGPGSRLTGFSLQTNRPDFRNVHRRTLDYINRSAKAGKPWVVACDEPGDASHALVPDTDDPTHDNARINALWGCLLAGGAGNEWYFGYRHAHSDLTCQDWRSRDRWWDQCRIALGFFHAHLPFWNMAANDQLTSAKDDFCFAQPGHVYAILLPKGGPTELDLGDAEAAFTVRWFPPRTGGELLAGTVESIRGPGRRDIGAPPSDRDGDWVALVTRQNGQLDD
ncbi:MAG: DUF5060 domain-containing protein [bacterium]